MKFRNKIISILISTIFCLLSLPTITLACTFESTLNNNRMDFKITSDIHNIQLVQLMHKDNASGAPYTIKALYGPSPFPWVQYLDGAQTYSGYSMIIQNRRQNADGAYWVNWIDSTHYTSIPSGIYSLEFTGTMNYENIVLEYGTITDNGTVGGTGEPWTFCTRTGEIGHKTATATPTTTISPTPTISPTTTPTVTTTPSPTPLPVENLKQYEGGWENEIYDHTVKTIKDWGCALTSAAMILRYHGHDIFPDSLNTWLNGEVDGYLRNGLVNWLAISRYTKVNNSLTSPTLEFKKLENSNQNLDNELDNKRPVILKEDGHFVVATGKKYDTYFINDPGYANRDTLESYGNSYLSLNSYTPTHSDLSYFMFVINPNMQLSLLDSNNNEVNYDTFIDQVISDGENVRILYFSKPPLGNYLLKVSGPNEKYTLDTYLYDINGNPIIKTFNGTIYGDEIDTYKINFTQLKNINISIDDILRDIKDGFDKGYFKNKGVYQSLKVHLEIYKKAPLEIFLKNIIKQVKNASPKHIDYIFSQKLIQDLQSLI